MESNPVQTNADEDSSDEPGVAKRFLRWMARWFEEQKAAASSHTPDRWSGSSETIHSTRDEPHPHRLHEIGSDALVNAREAFSALQEGTGLVTQRTRSALTVTRDPDENRRYSEVIAEIGR